jgi:hypothetical protein
MRIGADDKKTTTPHTHTHTKAYSRSFESEIESNLSNKQLTPYSKVSLDKLIVVQIV